MIEVDAARSRWPGMDFSSVLAVLWCPGDGYMTPTSVVNSYRSEAERMGVRFSTGTAVEEILRDGARVTGVKTSRGEVRCRYLINAAGAHAYHLAKLAGLELPIVPVRHEYFVTVELPGLDSTFPCFRIPDLTLYGRVEKRGLLLGGWETIALHADPRRYPLGEDAPAITPDNEILGLFEHKLAPLFPGCRAAPHARIGKGWPTFTPDGQFIIGESSQVPGFVMAGGCNAHGISGSGGIGKMLVESLCDEAPSDYVRGLSPDRFAAGAWNWEDATVQARRIYETYYEIES
jgi:glycine/D-amino acid oxidase-like deaminating enzyme